jgi:hypothetical protein
VKRELQVGDAVRLDGLVKANQYNGLVGKVASTQPVLTLCSYHALLSPMHDMLSHIISMFTLMTLLGRAEKCCSGGRWCGEDFEFAAFQSDFGHPCQ